MVSSPCRTKSCLRCIAGEHKQLESVPRQGIVAGIEGHAYQVSEIPAGFVISPTLNLIWLTPRAQNGFVVDPDLVELHGSNPPS